MKKAVVSILCCLLFLLVCHLLPAQSDSVIDHLLEQERASFGNAVYIALAGAGEIPADYSVQKAVAHLAQMNLTLKQRVSEDPIQLGEFALIVCKAFSIKGGILFRIFPRPRYAARELVHLELVQYDRNPYGYISGEEVLYIVGKVLDLKGVRM